MITSTPNELYSDNLKVFPRMVIKILKWFLVPLYPRLWLEIFATYYTAPDDAKAKQNGTTTTLQDFLYRSRILKLPLRFSEQNTFEFQYFENAYYTLFCEKKVYKNIEVQNR